MLLVAPLGGHLNRGARAVVATHSNPARVAAGVSERRGSPGADPVVAAVVAFGLLGEPAFELGAQGRHVDRIHHLQPLGVDGGERDRILEPVPYRLFDGGQLRIDALEVGRKAEIEVVQLGLVPDHDAAGEGVKPHQRRTVQAPRETFDQGQPLLWSDLEAMAPEAIEKREEDPGMIGDRRGFRHRRWATALRNPPSPCRPPRHPPPS